MTTTTTEQSGSDVGADGKVPDELVRAYREHGFVRVRGVLDPTRPHGISTTRAPYDD